MRCPIFMEPETTLLRNSRNYLTDSMETFENISSWFLKDINHGKINTEIQGSLLIPDNLRYEKQSRTSYFQSYRNQHSIVHHPMH